MSVGCDHCRNYKNRDCNCKKFNEQILQNKLTGQENQIIRENN